VAHRPFLAPLVNNPALIGLQGLTSGPKRDHTQPLKFAGCQQPARNKLREWAEEEGGEPEESSIYFGSHIRSTSLPLLFLAVLFKCYGPCYQHFCPSPSRSPSTAANLKLWTACAGHIVSYTNSPFTLYYLFYGSFRTVAFGLSDGGIRLRNATGQVVFKWAPESPTNFLRRMQGEANELFAFPLAQP
jgi:hypothetical protein